MKEKRETVSIQKNISKQAYLFWALSLLATLSTCCEDGQEKEDAISDDEQQHDEDEKSEAQQKDTSSDKKKQNGSKDDEASLNEGDSSNKNDDDHELKEADEADSEDDPDSDEEAEKNPDKDSIDTESAEETEMDSGEDSEDTEDSETGGDDTDGDIQSDCGSVELEKNPFGCRLAWGTNDSGGGLAQFGYLDFITKWVGYEVDKEGNINLCDGCGWLESQVSKTDLIPVYYAYFVGYLGHENGFQDGNQNPNGPNLTTDGAELIRQKWEKIVEMYAWYARKTKESWPDKPLVWLLEGDYVQYTGESQKNPLSYSEIAKFAAEVTCAIKSNMPKAVVSINHSTWNSDQVTHDFWGAIDKAGVAYDMVWTTGVANNRGYIEDKGNDNYYNHATATYAYLRKLTGRKIFVDTSFGLSAMADTWASAKADTLNARIADGVIAINVTNIPEGYKQAIASLAPSLGSTCK